MAENTFAGFTNIDEFVDHKLALLEKTDKTMKSLFGLMFSERENTFCESTDGYKIKKLTYGEAYDLIIKEAGLLSDMLIDEPKGEIIGLCLENSADWLITFWAILKSGYRPLLVNMRIDDKTLDGVFKEFNVRAVVSKDKKFGTKNIYIDDIKKNISNCTKTFEDERFGNEVLLMSSNSSSHLKICAYGGEQFYCQIKDSGFIIKECALIKKHYNGELKLLTFLPFYHIFGLVAVYIWFCFFSRTLVLLKDFNPKTILNTVRKHNVTHIFAVPIFWEKIYKTAMEKIKERGEKTENKFRKALAFSNGISSAHLQMLFSKIAFGEIRDNLFGDSVSFLINGGGYIQKEAVEFMNGIGYHLANGYGMTEIGITSVELSAKAKDCNLCSVGKPFKSLEYAINTDGELLVRGNSIAKTIYVDGEKIENKGEYFNTHDMFSLSDGRYYVNGRKDDLVICDNGENLNPDITEPELLTDGVKRICIIKSDSVILFAEVSKYLGNERIEEITSNLKKNISKMNLDTMINKIVLTSSPLIMENDFKVNRNLIKKRYEANEIIPLKTNGREGTDGKDELSDRIKEIFAESLNKPVEEITLDGHFFFDYGGSSLDYFAMITAIQNEFSVSFPTNVDKGISNVREMTEYIRERL